MPIVFLIGRIILGVYFLDNASHHFFQLKMVSGFAASRGVRAPKAAVLGGGVLLLAGGLSILTGYQPTAGIVALILFLLPVTLKIHTFWKFEDPGVKMAERINFTNNLALLSSLLMFLSIPQPWPFSLN
jgi:putative oxidoreductase